MDISNSFKKSIRMEVLSIDMELNIGFFVEFVHIEVLNTDTYIIITILKSKLKRKKKRLSSHENKKEEKKMKVAYLLHELFLHGIYR